MSTTISAKSCISAGWKTFWSRPWLFVKVAIVLGLIGLVTNLASWILEVAAESAGPTPASIVLGVLILALGIYTFYITIVTSYMGFTTLYLKAVDDVTTPTLKDLWRPHPFRKYMFAYVLMFLACIAGFILLIIPGIIIGLGLWATLYLVIDKGLGPIAAMKESWRLTRGQRLQLFWLGLLLGLLNLLGILALLVGLFVTIPVTYLSMAHAYRRLTAGTVPDEQASIAASA